MSSLNYESINYFMTQILKLSCASFSYVNISYVLAVLGAQYSFYLKSVATYAPAFLGYNNSALARVQC